MQVSQKSSLSCSLSQKSYLGKKLNDQSFFPVRVAPHEPLEMAFLFLALMANGCKKRGKKERIFCSSWNENEFQCGTYQVSRQVWNALIKYLQSKRVTFFQKYGCRRFARMANFLQPKVRKDVYITLRLEKYVILCLKIAFWVFFCKLLNENGFFEATFLQFTK